LLETLLNFFEGGLIQAALFVCALNGPGLIFLHGGDLGKDFHNAGRAGCQSISRHAKR